MISSEPGQKLRGSNPSWMRLKEYAILIDAVRESNPALKDADIFDVICHVAFDQPPLTRKERASNVKKRNYFGKLLKERPARCWKHCLTNTQRTES